MKTIKLKAYESPVKTSLLTRDRRHKVHLGNGLICYFESQKEAKSYLHQTNVFLNNKILEINKIYTEIFSEYRKIYIICFQFIPQVKVRDNIELIEKTFFLVLSRHDWANGIDFTWIHFNKILDACVKLINDITANLKKHNDYRYINNFTIYLEHVKYIREKLNTWGLEHQKNTPALFGPAKINLKFPID